MTDHLNGYDDLNDLALAEGTDAVRDHLDTAPNIWFRPDDDERAPPPPTFGFDGTGDLSRMDLPPLKWAVEGHLAEGFNVLAGRQKLGKSRLALDFAVAVATGGYAMGTIPCEQGDVLYIDLENGRRRVQRRLHELFPDKAGRLDMPGLLWAFEAPPIGGGFTDLLDAWVRKVEKPRLIVLDVLQRVKPVGGDKRQNSYERDYSTFAPIQQWALDNNVALLALHHTRKGGADDPLEALSGSNGLSAVADTTLVLDKDASGVTLYVRGRDVEERDAALRCDGPHWLLQGEASDVRRSDERAVMLAALDEAKEPLTPRDMSDLTGRPYTSVRQLLVRMAKAGEVEKPKRGAYALPGRFPKAPPKDGDNVVAFPPPDDD